MMKDPSKKYDLYTPLSEHTIADLYPIPTASGSHKVTVQHLKTMETHEVEVSFCAILIGSRPDLRFLAGIETTCETTPCNDIFTPNDSYQFTQDLDLTTLISKKFLWLKSLCAKCRHISKCDNKSLKKGVKICDHDERISCNAAVTNKEKKTFLLSNKSETDEKKKHFRSFGLGEDPTKPVDCKNNPIAVNKYTYQVSKYSNNLYALGPLAGDNFVRFIPGGALACTAALHNQNKSLKR